MASRPQIYLDSCCFIDYVKQEVGALPTDRERDAWFIKQLLLAHRSGLIVVNTSLVAVGECLSIEKGQAIVPEEAKDLFRRLMTSGQYVRLINPTPKTPRLMQDFRWNHGLVLGAIDSMHLAAAVETKCSEFITTDDRLRKPKVAAAIPAMALLGLRMICANQTSQLSSATTQNELQQEDER